MVYRTVAEKLQFYWNRNARIIIVALLTLFCSIMTLYFHLILGVGVVFTHVFYIPIVLAGIWFRRNSFIVTAFLGAVLISSSILSSIGGLTEDFMRLSVMFFVNTVTVLLSESLLESEEAVRYSEEKYRRIIETARDAIITVDSDGMVVSWNRGAEEMFGYSSEEVAGKPLETFIPAEHIEKHRFNEGNLEGISKFIADVEATRRDGSRFPVELTVVGWHYMDGDYVTAVIRDVSERKRAEARLRESEEKYRALFNLSPEYIILLDVDDGRILDINSTLAGKLMIPRERLIGRSVYDLEFISEDARREFQSKLETIKREGSVEPYEMELEDPAGNRYTVRIYNKRIHAGDGDSVIVVLSDITDLKRTQEMLERSLAEKELLLKEIHHRVKNNLMIISSLLSMQSRQIKDEDTLKIFRESENRARSMALIHERLYRSEDLKNVDISEYIRTLGLEIFNSYNLDPSMIRLSFDMQEFRADIETAIPIGLIFTELMTNAIKHAFPDGRGDIKVSLKRSDGTVTLEVSDNGVGLPGDLDWESTPSLGLQIVRGLSDQIDARVDVISDEGTTFRISFEELGFKNQ
ncbi:MAG: PAS domain S-box protein [Methanothermobacter wolfeii]|nr:PAS domain S-box protein [Methanothermobacter wolfeii]